MEGTMPPRIWWCNQSDNWKVERKAGVVSGSESEKSDINDFRKTVGQAKRGDIVLHYRKDRGIWAVSRAIEHSQESPRQLTELGAKHYGKGWRFRTEYCELDRPIERNLIIREIHRLKIKEGPVEEVGESRVLRVRQRYFMTFSIEALRVVYEKSEQAWPRWVEELLGVTTSTSQDGNFESFVEGGLKTAVATVRSRRLRNEAKEKYGLSCYCCGFKFEDFYGDIARDRAIVHHLETFHGKKGEERNSTVDDVRVVCANCHYVIHLTGEPLDVDVLKERIEKSWSRWTDEGMTRKTAAAKPNRSR
jgi:hypothetical protein